MYTYIGPTYTYFKYAYVCKEHAYAYTLRNPHLETTKQKNRAET